jgi:hypothetical protein
MQHFPMNLCLILSRPPGNYPIGKAHSLSAPAPNYKLKRVISKLHALFIQVSCSKQFQAKHTSNDHFLHLIRSKGILLLTMEYFSKNV